MSLSSNAVSMGRRLITIIVLLSSPLCLPGLSAAADNASLYLHENEPIGTVREIYDGRLMPDIQINTFRNIHRLFPTRQVSRGEEVSEFSRAERAISDFAFSIGDSDYDLFDVLALNRVAAMMIVQDD